MNKRPLRKALRVGLASASLVRRHPDVAAVFALFALTVLAGWGLFRNEVTLGSDAATQYYPWYYFLGESLWSGQIPAWNPYQFSGTPFAADPLSGWSYLPAMVLFSLLPLVEAVKGLMFSHLLLAGLFTYALGRTLGMSILGAFVAAVAYEYNGLFYLDNTCCLQYIGVMVWLPLAVLGAELAIRSRRWAGRGLWWGISGLALSQALASWFGQGSYYALLALGGYIAYRTLLSPPGNVPGGLAQKMGVSYQMLGGPFLAVPTFVIRPRSLRKVALLGIRGLCKAALGIRGRLLRCVLHGGAVLVFGFALAAFGVLPRLEYNALSNLAGGYPTEVRGRGGWSSMDYWTLLLEPGVWYAGVGVLVLAVVAPLVARKRFAVPYFAALSLCALVLSGQGPTLLHSALYYLLPLFERLHPHDPDRILMLFYLGAALLAGAALSGLKERARENPSLLVPRLPAGRNLAFALLALVVFADLFVADRATMAEQDFSGPGWAVKTRKVDLAEYYSPSGAARFLQSKSEEEEPFRYFGYDPELEERWHISSPMLFAEPRTRALEANARSMVMGLQNVQGYNPTHIARYDQFMEALNGDAQDYHFMDIFEKGLDSPLLNLLNVRYIIVPAHNSQENQRRGLQHSLQPFERFEGEHPTVYEDDQSKVLENPKALPRAWIVHSARQVASAKEALKLLSSEQVDPKQIALLEEQPPEGISQPAEDPSAEQATLEDYEANRIKLKTSTGTAGLVVLSEVYYPAWKAYVDGKPAPIYVTDGLLRSVMVPAGEHEVELRYESWALRVGIAISVAAYAALMVLAVGAVVWRWQRKKSVYPAKEAYR